MRDVVKNTLLALAMVSPDAVSSIREVTKALEDSDWSYQGYTYFEDKDRFGWEKGDYRIVAQNSNAGYNLFYEDPATGDDRPEIIHLGPLGRDNAFITAFNDMVGHARGGYSAFKGGAFEL